MPVILSAAAVEALLKKESGDPLLVFATITHPSIEPVRIVRNYANKNEFHLGDEFTAAPFDVTLTADVDEIPRGSMVVPNVDKRIGHGLKLIAGQDPAEVRFVVALASDPDDIIRRFARLQLVSASINPISVSAELMHPNLTVEPWPKESCTPSTCPALFLT